MLRDFDNAPTLAMLIALLLFLGTFVLVAIGRDIPPIITTGDGLALTFVFVTSAQRGNSPPGPPPAPKGGSNDAA